MFLVNGPILVIGRARSGEAAANLIRASHPEAEIAFYDDKKELSDFENPRDLLKKKWAHVILSPGYPDKPWFEELKAQDAIFTQELDVAAAYMDTEKIYAITGSVGKSTCAWVAKEVLKSIGKEVFLGGNFGIPFAEYALKKLKGEKVEYVILELSSYQIERMAFMLDRALILNLLPNHLDRYPDLETYYKAKLKIFRFCREGVWAMNPGADLYNFAKEQGLDTKLKWIKPDQFEHLFKASNLLGQHNRGNLAAVMELIASPELDESEVVNALRTVEALPHRIEIFEHNGMYFVNDSKATTVESVLTAYAAIRERFENEKLFWLLGGRDKKLPWQRLKRLWSDKQLSFIFFGECAELAKAETGFEGQVFPKLSDALNHLQGKILGGDILVLSPAGTSLDEFKSFEERGDFFKSSIMAKF